MKKIETMKNEVGILTMKYLAYDIKYDTDGKRVKLPKKLEFDVSDPDFSPDMDLADLISDKTGWCVNSFKFSII